ncbi:hypothetical protein [Nocardia sp. NPDC004860]|uniref:hypothetical protein n=1 Tax=Nocardia sp. NPDC004860 TaxID=3154557 RepID=UPI0033AC247F
MVDTSKVDFDPKVASTAISACQTLIEHLLTVQSFLGSRQVDQFAGPPEQFNSGEVWAEGFRKLDKDLGGALNGHITVVTDLSEKFKTAIKEFKNAEDESIAGFLNQKMPDKLTNPAGLGPDYSKVSSKIPTPNPVEKYTQNGKNRSRTDAYNYNDLKLPAGNDRTVWPENPHSKDWNALRGLGESIKGVPGRLAADWGWMKDELNKAVETFKSATNDGHFRNSWTSGSGPIALAAVDSARTAITDLTAKMGDVEDRLYKAEGWLKATAERMPKGAEPAVSFSSGGTQTGGRTTQPRYGATDNNRNVTYTAATANDCMEMILSKYRQDCEAYYVAGIMEYNSSLVAVPQPQVPTAPAPPAPQPEQPKKDQPAGTPQVSPSGSPTGGNPSTPTTPTDTPTTPNTPTTPTTPTTQNPTNTNTDTTLSTITSAFTTLAQDGVQMVESLATQGSSLIQSLVSSAQKTTDTTTQQLEQQLTSLLNPTTPTETASPGGTPTSPGGTPTGGTPSTPKVETPKSQLFPRATVTAEEEKTDTVTASRAGLATGTTTSTGTSSGTGMSPMGAGAGAGQSGGKEHKRPEFLRSGQNLDDVFDAVPEAVRPVAEK